MGLLLRRNVGQSIVFIHPGLPKPIRIRIISIRPGDGTYDGAQIDVEADRSVKVLRGELEGKPPRPKTSPNVRDAMGLNEKFDPKVFSPPPKFPNADQP